MDYKFNDTGHIQNMFEEVLGVKPKINDNIEGDEEMVFVMIIKNLENSKFDEDKVYEFGMVDLTKITDPLWSVIEGQFQLLYGKGAVEDIMWYLCDRVEEDGVINHLSDKNGKKFTLKDPKDLWKFIKHTYL